MNIFQIVLALIVIITSIPIGLILKSLTKEELHDGKKYFLLLWIGSLLIFFIILLININDSTLKYSILFSLIFFSIVSFISWYDFKIINNYKISLKK